ncbi:divalent cation tolerance protein CutA [Lacrimispora amygdalina]
MKIYENFISYRRSATEGALLAQNIYNDLIKEGYDTFCDVRSLNSGQYGNEIFEIIVRCTNFLIVLTPNTFDGDVDESDWMYMEYSQAIRNKKNIIPIFINKEEVLLKLPDNFQDLKLYNGIEFNVDYSDVFLRILCDRFLLKDNNDLYYENGDGRDFIIDRNRLVKYVGKAKHVRISEGIEIIGEFAFKDLTEIEKISLPSTIIEIQESAFERCRNLSFIEIPDTTVAIGKKAFSRCFNLSYVRLGEDTKSIEDNAFSFCDKLKRIEITSHIERIDCNAFNNCSKLQEILVSNENIFYSSMDGVLYDKEKSIVIRCPEGIRSNIIQLPSTIIEIGQWAFSRCRGVYDIVIPQGVKIIEGYAFKECINISCLTLPDTIEKFDISAIDGWSFEQRILFDNRFNQAMKYKIEESLKSKKVIAENEFEEKFMLIKTTFESKNEAVEMANMLLEKKLITSGQISKLHSIYRWNSKIDSEDEYELSCITESRLYYQIEEFIKENHSYELCQILCVPVLRTSVEFADWISNNITCDDRKGI